MSFVGQAGTLFMLAPQGEEGVLYIGGNFTTVRGEDRNRVAAVSSSVEESDPSLLAWDPDCDERVLCMALHGTYMYLGGHFNKVGGEDRNAAAAVDASPNVSDPQVMCWNPDCKEAPPFEQNAQVHCMILSGDAIYLGGRFVTVRGETRNRVAVVEREVDMTEPFLYDWNPNCDGTVECLLLHGDDMYVGGRFTSIRSTARNRLATVDSNINAANPSLRVWNPDCNNHVECMVLNEDDLYIGGWFTTVRGVSRNRLAAIDSDVSQAAPAVRPWNPNSGGIVWTLLLASDVLYVGGQFTTIGGEYRHRIAAIDSDVNEETPELKPWNLDYSIDVRHMILEGSTLYTGGSFTSIDSVTRNHAAAVSSDTSQANPTLRPWNPNCNSTIRCMLLV